MRFVRHLLVGGALLICVGYISALLGRSACEDVVAQSVASRIEKTFQGREAAVLPARTPGVVEILERNGVATVLCDFSQEGMCWPFVGVEHARVSGPFFVSVREAFEGYSARRRFIAILGFVAELSAVEIIVA